MSIVATLPVFLLSNSLALHKLLAEDCLEHILHTEKAECFWRRWVSMASRMWDASRPGHVFNLRWEKYVAERGVEVVKALACLGEEYLQVVNRHLYVQSWEKFSRWQNLRGRMSMLPVKSYMLYRHDLPMCSELLHPLSPSMEDFINHHGLNESHLHLFACQEAELSWLLDLNNLSEFEKKETQNWESHCDLYYGIHAELSPSRFINRMLLAKLLRSELLGALSENVSAESAVLHMSKWYQELVSCSFFYVPDSSTLSFNTDLENMLPQEMQLWRMLFKWVDDEKTYARELCFFAHVYLLIQNEYIHLRRQRTDRLGFDGFSEVARHKNHGLTDSQYLKRTFLNILRNTRATPQNYIEVRVSPNTVKSQGAMIAKIWKETCNELSIAPPKLVLVSHFIKSKGFDAHTVGAENNMETYAALRKAYQKDCKKLADYVPYLCDRMGITVGIDAAGDELVTPPEVLASVYRQFEQKTHISYKTYHCGEDFIHLVGGIRAVYDAAIFLDLRNGNRVGHATAIGIDPVIWKQDMPDVLVFRKGDLLLDLIFAWKMLITSCLDVASRVERKLMPLAQELLGESVSIHSLLAFYDARGFMPEEVSRFISAVESKTPENDFEAKIIKKFARERGRTGLEMLRHWHEDAGSRRAQAQFQELELDFFDNATLVYLQQRVQHELNERNVVIETLPVSNLRISQYRDIREHHILRWLRVPGCGYEGDEEMTVCMGSDDPGIFVSNLKNEFYHVFACLRQAGLSPAECMKYIHRLNEAGRIYSFNFSAEGEAL